MYVWKYICTVTVKSFRELELRIRLTESGIKRIFETIRNVTTFMCARVPPFSQLNPSLLLSSSSSRVTREAERPGEPQPGGDGGLVPRSEQQVLPHASLPAERVGIGASGGGGVPAFVFQRRGELCFQFVR